MAGREGRADCSLHLQPEVGRGRLEQGEHLRAEEGGGRGEGGRENSDEARREKRKRKTTANQDKVREKAISVQFAFTHSQSHSCSLLWTGH